MTTLRVVIRGRVQGVGYRDWLSGRATALGVDGWVRNRRDGSVEALLHGPAPAVADLLRACWRGPPLAAVAAIDQAPDAPPAAPGFLRRPTA